MAAPYDSLATLPSPSALATLARVAADLGRARPCRVPPLLLLSDRDRTPDLLALARRLPRESGLIYREARGAHDPELAGALRDVTADRGVTLLIGADERLAERVGADGVHLPREAGTGTGTATALRADHPDWIITRAAPRDGSLPNVTGLDALLLSSVFASASPSAGTALGLPAFTSRVAALPCPVIALGGVTAETAPGLIGTGAAGLAAIDGLAHALRSVPMISTAQTHGPIVAEPKSAVSITKDEGGEMVTYTATVAGASETGELTLRRVADGVWNANHTGVPGAIGGRGVGKALVQAMVEDARAQGWRIVPGCPFVAKLFERKPDWAAGIT